MQINEAVYGAKNTWIDARTYDSSVPAANRVKYANFGDNDSSIYKAYQANILPLEEAWDKSLSYAALGPAMPLSNIDYYYGNKDSSDPLIPEILNSDRRTVTNYALGTSSGMNAYESYVDYIAVDGEEFSVQRSRYNRYTNGAAYNNTYSYWDRFSPLTQIPMKRTVIVPFIEAYRADFSYGQQFDLKNYITNQKSEYKRITRIFITMYSDYNNSYDPETGTGTVNRQALNYQLCGGVILDNLSYGNGFAMDGEELDNIFKPIIGNAIAGALFNSRLPDNLTTTTTWCVPVCGGFGLDFSNIYGVNQLGQISSNSRFYCDADALTADEIKEAVRHIVAGFGLFFADSEVDAQNEKLDSDKIMLGILVNGVGNGDYSIGQANRNQDQWEMDDAHDIDYDPSNPPEVDPNSYDDGFIFPGSYSFGIAGINNRYLISTTNILTLSNALWDFSKNLQPEEVLDNINKTFLTNNPIDLIVSLQFIPLKDISFGTASAVKLGRLNLGINAPSVLASQTYDCGSIKIFPTFGDNWISKQIRIFAYLPFCGTAEIDLEAVMGKDLYLRYIVDTYTGSCTAVLYIVNERGKNIIITTADGNCVTEIPVTGIQWETLNANLYNAYQTNKQLKLNNTIAIAKSLTGFGSAISSGDAASSALAGLDVIGVSSAAFTAEKISDYNLSHTQVPMRVIGGSSGITSNLLDLTPKLLFYRPIDHGSEAFISTEGVACILNGTLESLQLSGYTEVAKIDLNGISATATEKEMIKSLLAGGIYV